MPSDVPRDVPRDVPPIRPSGLLRSTVVSGGTSGQAARPATGPIASSAGASSAGAKPDSAGPPSIVNPALRRYWHRDSEADEFAETGQRRRSDSYAWAIIIAMALIAAVLIRQGPGLLEPPPRVLAPVSGVTSDPISAAAPLVAAPDLMRDYGIGAINQAGAIMDRAGRAAEQAIICGVRTRAWVNDAREALASDVIDRFPSFEPERNLSEMMRQYLATRFIASQKRAPQDVAEHGRAYVCDNLPYSPDYGMVVQAAQQADQARQ